MNSDGRALAKLTAAALLLLILVFMSRIAQSEAKRENYRPPKRAEPPKKRPDYVEPLSMAEIEAMARDAPLLVKGITDNHMMITNGSIATKSFMDAVGPVVMQLLEKIEDAQDQLPPETTVRLNTTEVRERFNRDWRECNSTFEKTSAGFAIKTILDKMNFENLRQHLKEMTLEEQIKMRNVYTHARDKLVEIHKAPMITKYKETTDNSVSVLYKTLLELMSAHKDIRYQLMVHRTRALARDRFKELWEEISNSPSAQIAREVPAPEQGSHFGRYSA